MTEESEIKESATVNNTRTDTPDTHVKSENQSTDVNDGEKYSGDEVKEGASETKEDTVEDEAVKKQGKDEKTSGEKEDDKKEESVESNEEKHNDKEEENRDNEDSKKGDLNKDNLEKKDIGNENPNKGNKKETSNKDPDDSAEENDNLKKKDHQDTKKSDEDDKDKIGSTEVDKPDKITQDKISEEDKDNHIAEEVKEETEPGKPEDTPAESKEETDSGLVNEPVPEDEMGEKESRIEKQEDVERNEVDGSETNTRKKDDEADTTTKGHSEETELKTDKNECLVGEGGEKSLAISTIEDEKVAGESEQKDADEGNGINKNKENEEGENKAVEKDGELPEVQPEEEPKSDTPKESVDDTVAGDTLEQGGRIETVEDSCEENTGPKDGEKTGEVDQTDGGLEAGGVSESNVEEESKDQGKQSEDAGPDEGSKETGEDQADVGKSDAPNEEANEESGMTDGGKTEWMEEDEPNEKPEAIEIEKVKEAEHSNEGNDLVEDQLASKADISDTQQSPSSQKDQVKDPETQTEEQRVRSGTVYRVQTDYLTRQVIAKQEKEIYLEEKLSETTRDLEIAERKVKDLQLRLKRFVKDDEVKDSRMRQMEKEYRDLAEQMRKIEETLDSKSKNNNVGEVSNGSPKLERRKSSSKVCVIL